VSAQVNKIPHKLFVFMRDFLYTLIMHPQNATYLQSINNDKHEDCYELYQKAKNEIPNICDCKSEHKGFTISDYVRMGNKTKYFKVAYCNNCNVKQSFKQIFTLGNLPYIELDSN
jgi:hypothetical protein